jgi:hypothetical protein
MIKRFFFFWIGFCILLSIYTYIGDCIFNFRYAIKHINFLPAYVFLHLYQSYIIFPAFVLYFYFFGKREGILALKTFLLIIIVVLIELYLRPDDWSLYIGKHRDLKQIVSYILAILSVLFIDEAILKKGSSKSHQSILRL